uniref:Placental growth factor n=1 Tax=Cairina moschata TaxID=8855 RepID=A0A8C3BUR3_CAIMO
GAAMRLLGAFLRLLLAGALGAPSPPWSLAVVSFKEIWNRSFCRPLEQLVDVIAEFPNEVEYIFRPSCVALQRCGGCCGDEGLRCVPVETSTVTMQVSAASGPLDVQPGLRAGLWTDTWQGKSCAPGLGRHQLQAGCGGRGGRRRQQQWEWSGNQGWGVFPSGKEDVQSRQTCERSPQKQRPKNLL